MSGDDIERPDEGGDDADKERGQNPFAGTPFEQMMSAFMSGQAGAQPGGPVQGMPDLSTLLSQVQRMLAPHEGSVNWDLAKEVARAGVSQAKDPSPTSAEQTAVADAVRLADLWLDTATEFGSATTQAVAWSRAEWVEATMPVWQRLVEPVAGAVVEAMSHSMPAEAQAMAGPILGMLGQAGGAMFGTQVGQAVGGLASEVVNACEIGLPLGPEGHSAILPTNAREFGTGLGLEESDVLLYIALRECAAQRLFKHVPWLRAHLFGAVEEYGRGITIDMGAIQQSLQGFDPTNPEALNDALSGGLFEPEQTPAQAATLVRLETALALVEGWIDEVVGQATSGRMPAAGQLHEAVRRRRASGGPAEQTFAALVGLELRPRRLRDAAALWGSVRSARGVESRDAVWSHPDLLPTTDDLDDPLGFAEKTSETRLVEQAQFDAALADLLEQAADDDAGARDEPAIEPGPDDADADDGPDDPSGEASEGR
jgi:putative hydrolase